MNLGAEYTALFILRHASRTTTFKFYAELRYNVYRTSVVTYTEKIFKVIYACREDHAFILIWLDFSMKFFYPFQQPQIQKYKCCINTNIKNLAMGYTFVFNFKN